MIRQRWLLLLLAGVTNCVAAVAQDVAASAEIVTTRDELAAHFRIGIEAQQPEFPVRIASGLITGAPAAAPDVQLFTPLLVAEFSRYPVELVQKTRLKRIVLCRDLAFAGQLRTALPDVEHDTLFLDVCRGSDNPTYQRKVIHHEYFHMIDFRDDGRYGPDERWAALNPTSFTYGEGGVTAQSRPDTSVLTLEFPGFLNHYSTTAVEEDKAELFANLMVEPSVVLERCRTDAVLATKCEALKLLMADFCPAVDGAFWPDAALSVPDR